jgi:hypothetical protein
VADVSFADVAVLAFILIPLLLVASLAWGVLVAWRATGRSPASAQRAAAAVTVAAATWMFITWRAATSGVLRNWDATPPPFALLVLAIILLASAIALGPIGRGLAGGLPIWILIGVHGFRLPLELAMHAMYERGVMPVEMSYAGRNFDVITGVTALIVAPLLASGRGGRLLAAAWNVLGLALLINVMVIAILSTPRFRYFGDDHLNIWVTYPPFVWLPAVMVLAALAGHLVIFRALASSTSKPIDDAVRAIGAR